MTEYCPLFEHENTTEIPEFCQQHCIDRLNLKALPQLEYDKYTKFDSYFDPNFDVKCEHKESDLVYSHEGLQSIEGVTNRLYAIVYACGDCGEEDGESAWQFTCPNIDPR